MGSPAPGEAPVDPEKAADEEIEIFQRWFSSLGESPLTRYERAILKTYIVSRLRGDFDTVL